MILETRYHLPAPTTSPRTVQPDDVMGGHRGGENSPQERPPVSEEEEKMAVDGTSSTDEGKDFISQTKVETDNEPLQLADCHFELVTFRQQQGTMGETAPFK